MCFACLSISKRPILDWMENNGYLGSERTSLPQFARPSIRTANFWIDTTLQTAMLLCMVHHAFIWPIAFISAIYLAYNALDLHHFEKSIKNEMGRMRADDYFNRHPEVTRPEKEDEGITLYSMCKAFVDTLWLMVKLTPHFVVEFFKAFVTSPNPNISEKFESKGKVEGSCGSCCKPDAKTGVPKSYIAPKDASAYYTMRTLADSLYQQEYSMLMVNARWTIGLFIVTILVAPEVSLVVPALLSLARLALTYNMYNQQTEEIQECYPTESASYSFS